MLRSLFYFLLLVVVVSCATSKSKMQTASTGANPALATVLEDYYKQRMAFFPVEATLNGDTAYNDKLYADFTDSYRTKLKDFYTTTLRNLHQIDRAALNEDDKISYDFMAYYNSLLLQDLDFSFNRIPTDQMWGAHLMLGQFASGGGAQPFKTMRDYNNWLRRIDGIDVWMDSAIVYFKKGLAEGITLPKPLVEKLIPQFEAMVTTSPETNLYYSPVKTFPASFTESEKQQLTAAYKTAITEKVIPMNQRMAAFLKTEYLPNTRTTSGYSAMPRGADYYKLRVKFNTTTDKTPDEIYALGLSEVARIRSEMEKAKTSVNFKGDLPQFFEYLKTDAKFRPYKTPEDVLTAFRQIYDRLQPQLKKEFNLVPKTPFEIRQTEAFRQESASAEYIASPDNIKPGVFYVPIIDATQFATTSGMESLFLHEAVPGHHYQISLQRENKALPRIRQYDAFSNAYVEGWALYCESLGKELDLYTDPYQYMGALGDEMHRAIRLVVDVAIHTKGMTREEAIKYMLDNEPISEQGATAEIERYMSGPGQALGYKIGALKIRELRTKYSQQLGTRFNVAAFHDAVLKDGSMPLTTLESKLDRWAASVK
ncbi:MAG TPA: DUF885 domain-containing protein [Chitinophagaceae bacterium]|nr:DUF885 domain-containing protein [Chitinophagaceae bacterium]